MIKGSKKLVLVWIASILIALPLLVIGYQIGKIEDCRPGQVDGQCGLSTFVWLFNGAVAGLVILLCATVYSVVYIYRRRKTTSGSHRVSGG